MADKYVNQTDLAYYHNRIKTLFPSASDFSDLQDQVADLVTEGGEPNVIETVKVNGTALPVTDKAVDVSVPTAVTDLTDASSYATVDYVDNNAGTIRTIKVNGTEQTITNKTVDITVPTQVSDLTNDAQYQTQTEVEAAISAAVASAYVYKGSVATVDDLPASAETGDVYDVQATGMNYAWNGTAWDALGQYVDTSIFWTQTELVAMTTAEIDAIINGD